MTLNTAKTIEKIENAIIDLRRAGLLMSASMLETVLVKAQQQGLR